MDFEELRELLRAFRLELITAAAGLLVVAVLVYFSAVNEAAAFNRLTTGLEVTVWDAVWLDLRVEAR